MSGPSPLHPAAERVVLERWLKLAEAGSVSDVQALGQMLMPCGRTTSAPSRQYSAFSQGLPAPSTSAGPAALVHVLIQNDCTDLGINSHPALTKSALQLWHS